MKLSRILLNLRIAVRSLEAFKVRTALAVLGVFLGTFSLILVSNLSGSLKMKTELELESLGNDLLIVRSGLMRRFGPGTSLISDAATLRAADATAVAEGASSVLNVSPAANKTFPIRFGSRTLSSVLVTGVTSSFSEIRNFRVKEGAFVTEDDHISNRKVAVLGRRVVDKLFGDSDPIGQYVMIWRVPCRIIGVMEEKGVDISGADQDNQIFVPLNMFLRSLVNRESINSIYVQAVSTAQLPLAKSQIEDIMRRQHKIGRDKKDDFTVIDLKDVVKLKSEATGMVTVLGRMAALVSFTIGGIGILSIMILIVNERRIEIGIRRAVGSRRRDIMTQFIVESSFISFVGGTAGVVASVAVSLAVFKVSGLPVVISPVGHMLAFVATIGVGILAGIYPSRKAVQIQPVDIIRSV
ncbi:MAG: hypothetical protein FD164_301 [Nitrospirae bacterium]|nr:MAG: hypothetical protein FD164_301 [Nitrospirota bacterium]